MPTSELAAKAAIRTRLLARRSALPPSDVARMSQAILERLRSIPLWASVREAMLYAPIRNEVNTWPVLEELWGRGVRTLLPRCRSCAPGEMEWAAAACRADMAPGAFSIPEPNPATCAPADELRPDLILLPGVAFDREGFRLGYGGGYYDRLLATPALSGAITVGLAFSFQLLDSLPRDPWDRPVNLVVTEKESAWVSI
jgi:5-formyltetrahydrofolate cyclo-ligase